VNSGPDKPRCVVVAAILWSLRPPTIYIPSLQPRGFARLPFRLTVLGIYCYKASVSYCVYIQLLEIKDQQVNNRWSSCSSDLQGA
jgi:hypothetical protein